MSQEKDPNLILLKNVRLSYPQLWEAKQIQGQGDPKFQATFIMDDKEHAALIAHIDKQIERVALDQFKKKVPLKHKCLHDGNEKEDDGYGDGKHFLVTSSKRRPVVVGADKVTPLTEAEGVIYAGCFVHASIRLYAYDNKFGKGVSAELRAVMFAKDGESFGAGKVNVEDEFAEVEANDEAFD